MNLPDWFRTSLLICAAFLYGGWTIVLFLRVFTNDDHRHRNDDE